MTGPVEEMVWCRWEAANVPVDHHCVGGQPSECPTAAGDPCGRCGRCLKAQTADLVRHGSPSDMNVPPEPTALAYIADGRVRVVEAHRANASANRPTGVLAFVSGYRGAYSVRGTKGSWLCPCTSRLMAEVADQCPHAAAVALCTGWPSAAGPLAPQPAEESST
jgi:hypothetical protein